MKLHTIAFASIAYVVMSQVALAQTATRFPANVAPNTSVGVTSNTQGLAPKAPADGCEMHLWPGARMNSITQGLFAGAFFDWMHAGTDATNKTMLASALDSPAQLDALQSLELRTLLPLTPGTTIVRHDTPLDRSTMNKVKARRSDSTALCYSELIVADVLYQKSTIGGRWLKTLFLYRNFGTDQTIDGEYQAWADDHLKLFPPKEGEDAIAALDELGGVFKGNFDEFARNARSALARKAK